MLAHHRPKPPDIGRSMKNSMKSVGVALVAPGLGYRRHTRARNGENRKSCHKCHRELMADVTRGRTQPANFI